MMTKYPFVSVVLPFKNSAETLESSVNSILAQTYQNLELITINDNSIDNSIDVLQTIDDQRLIIIDSVGNGLVDALNRGLEFCSGEFIARMDADDISHPERIAEQVNFLLQNSDIGVASCQVEYRGDKEKFYGYYTHVKWLNDLCEPDRIFLRRFQDSPVAHPSVMFIKTLIDAYGSYHKGDFPEDYELWLRWMSKGVKFGKVRRPLLVWRDHAGRLSRTDPSYSTEAFFQLKARYLALWLKDHYLQPPSIYIWGAGSSVKQKSQWLNRYNIEISGYIDVKVRKTFNNKPVIHYKNLAQQKIDLILVFVSDRKGKDLILNYLLDKEFIEGRDFIFMA